jgi:gluconolactonase
MEQDKSSKYLDLSKYSDIKAELPKGLDRRGFMKLAAAAAVGSGAALEVFAGDRYSDGAPPTRYPEPDVIGLDKRFKHADRAPASRHHVGGRPGMER